MQWFDSTHIAAAQYYREWVGSFGARGFIESSLGPAMIDDAVSRGLEAAVATWRAWLYDDGDEAPAVAHLNGSRRCAERRLRRSHCHAEAGEAHDTDSDDGGTISDD